ncbi:hypothetical protein N9544_00685 [Flavobacteriales bacterium]|nr:hypothetical protein [Flavobacteriales bacterium]
MNEIRIKTSKTARIYISNEITKNTKEVIIACHGYAQLGKYFIKKFESICNDERAVVVPEALNKFYWNGMNGRVVASWMTKEDRESEIEDYINYLNQIYEVIREKNKDVKIIAFGFSQGSSTISRWIAQKNINIECERLILWSGSFPLDVIEELIFKTIPFQYLFGNEDEYYSKERIQELELTLNNKGVTPEFIEFKGGHKIYEETLQKLMSEI